MDQYKQLIKDVLTNGETREDRTGVGTISIFGHQSRYRMDDGFPATTSKKLAWKMVVSELLWMLSGSSDERKLAEIYYKKPRKYLKDKKTIWTANANAQGVEKGHENSENFKLLGPIYGNQMRNICDFNNYKIKEIKIKTYTENYKIPPMPEIIFNDDLSGAKIIANSGRVGVVIKKIGRIGSSKSDYYEIYSLDTGIISKCNKVNITNGKILPKLRSGVGDSYYDGQKPNYYKKALKMWGHMIDRCYDTSHKEYINYGKKGIIVSKRWHIFSNFVEDLEMIPGFYNWVSGNYELDKDYYGSKVYSRQTCIFMPHKNNCLLRDDYYNGEYLFTLNHNNGISYDFINPSVLIDDIGGSKNGLSNAIKSGKMSYNGMHITKRKAQKGMIYRYEWHQDQIYNLVHGLKTEPFSRRHVVNLWNVADLDKMSLAPCHVMAQFYVHSGKLSCQMYQRSSDLFLGAPFNIAFYSLMLHLVSKSVDLIPGEFIYTIGDAHIYINHLDQVNIMLNNNMYNLPTLSIDDNFDLMECIVNGFDTSSIDMFVLNNYQSCDTIKAEMAV